MTEWIRNHQQDIIKIVGSLLAFGSLFFLFQQQSWDGILDAARQITWPRFFLAAGFLVLSRLFTIARWHVLLRSGGVDISLMQTTSITFTGLFATNFLPTTIGGDIVRLGGVMQLGESRVVSAASLVVDRLVGMFGMAMLLPSGLLLLGKSYASSPVFFAGVFPFEKWRKRVIDILRKLVEALRIWLKKPAALFFALLFSWGHMLNLFLALFVIANGLEENVSFWVLAQIWCLAYFVTLLPISINGYGMQELSLTYLLSNLGGMDLANSLIVAILIRIVFILASLPGAVFLPKVLSLINKKESLS